MPVDPDEGGLQRRLGRRQMTMLGLGGAIGTGLFLGSSLALSEAGPGVIIAYVACALIALVIAFSVVLLAINSVTVSLFGEAEYWFSMIKVVAISVFILLGAFYLFFGLPGHSSPGTANFTAHGGFLPRGMHGLALASVFVIFSFIGTEVVAVTAAESKDPRRDIPRAARSMVFRLSLFYILAIAIVVALVPWTTTANGGTLLTSPFVRLFDIAGFPAAASVVNFGVLTAAMSSANTNIYLTTRMLHSLALHRYAPRWFGQVSGQGVPRAALTVSAAGLAIAAVLSVYSPNNAYEAMFGISVFGALVVWILILVTHAAFRRKRGPSSSPVRLWGAPVTSGLAVIALAGILVSTGFINGMAISWKAGLPFFAILLVSYAVVARRRQPDPAPVPVPSSAVE